MSVQNLSLANVINISVATPQMGLGALNTSNLAIFSRETYASTFGTLGYKIYLSPVEVGIDFGTSSNTYAMSLAIFSQQPNILANGGYLVVIPFLSTAQDQIVEINFPGVPASGSFEITYNSNSTSSLAYNATASTIQLALRSVATLGSALVTGGIPAGLQIDAGFTGIGHPFTISNNSLEDANSNAIVPTVTIVQPGSSAETIDQAILRTQGTIQYFGVMSAEIPSQIVMLAGAALIQTLNKIAFWVSYTSGDISPGGMLDLLRSGGYTQSRGLFYDDVLGDALTFMAAYAGRALSTVFSGSNTTQTMNLKTLNTIQPDPNLTQTLLNQAITAGADTYPSIAGVPKVFCSGANDFFDDQYNLQWLIITMQVNGFNALAQTNTKIPQTENGMNILKGGYRQACEQAVANQFLAPGAWNSSTLFGPGSDLVNNIANRGYYIYSSPVAQQSEAIRVTRAAPLVQIAIKYAGAIQSSSVIVNVNP
jgi:hypothetical protein